MEFAFLDLLSPFESVFNESAVLTLDHDIDNVQLHKWRYRCSTTERVHKLLAPEAFRMAVAHGKEMLVHMYVLYTYTHFLFSRLAMKTFTLWDKILWMEG